MTLELGILLALGCALASNLGNFLKHRGCHEATAVDIRRPLRTAASLWRQGWFAIGMLVGGAAWALHVAAITIAPLSVVQTVLAGGVVLIAVMADRMFGMKVGRRQWIGLGFVAVGLAMLAITTPVTNGANSSFSLAAMIGFEAGLFALGGLFILGPRVGAPAEHHGVLLAAASGILFGVCNIAVKALTGLVGEAGVLGLVSPWLLVAACASFLAFFSSARSLQDGGAVEVIAITGTAANIACIAGGIVVFGDPLPGTAVGIVVQAFAFILVIVASAMTPAPRAATGGAPSPARAGGLMPVTA